MSFNSTSWRRLEYTLWAPVYDVLAIPLATARRRSLDRLALEPGLKVLLVGAGTGLDLEYLPAGVHVTAIDLATAMVGRLRGRAARLGLAVDARVMDAETMAFPDASFDAVVLHLILAVVPDPARCAREVGRVLCPGGRAVVLDKFVPDAGPVPLNRRLLNPIASFFGTEITRRLRPMLRGSGLRVHSVESAGGRGYLQIALLVKDESKSVSGGSGIGGPAAASTAVLKVRQ